MIQRPRRPGTGPRGETPADRLTPCRAGGIRTRDLRSPGTLLPVSGCARSYTSSASVLVGRLSWTPHASGVHGSARTFDGTLMATHPEGDRAQNAGDWRGTDRNTATQHRRSGCHTWTRPSSPCAARCAASRAGGSYSTHPRASGAPASSRSPRFASTHSADGVRRNGSNGSQPGPRRTDSGYVFTTEVGTPIDPDNLHRSWRKMTTKAGLGPLRFHALRHSAATVALARGVPLEIISRQLGHAGYAITADVYAHVGQAAQRDAADAMQAALEDWSARTRR